MHCVGSPLILIERFGTELSLGSLQPSIVEWTTANYRELAVFLSLAMRPKEGLSDDRY